MKKVFSIIAVALAAIMPMQAQLKPVAQNLSVNSERQELRQLPAETTAEEVTVGNLVGVYTAYAESAFEGEGAQNWYLSISADDKDANKVWIQPILLIGGVGESEVLPVYATLNNNVLSIPLGQCVFEGKGVDVDYNMVMATTTDFKTPITTGNIEASVSLVNNEVTIVIEDILGVGNLAEGEGGWWYQAFAYIEYTMSLPIPKFYIYGTDKESYKMVEAENIYFNEINNKMYATTLAEAPSNDLAGTYNAYGTTAVQGGADGKWAMTIAYDKDDSTKVCISNLIDFNVDASAVKDVYATYNKTAGTLTLPLGQELYTSGSTVLVTASIDQKQNIKTTGEVVMTVESDGFNRTILCEDYLGVSAKVNPTGFYQLMYPIEYTKLVGEMIALEDIDRITRLTPPTGTFFRNGTYKWNGIYTDDGQNYKDLACDFTITMVADSVDVSQAFTGVTSAKKWNVDGLLSVLSGAEETTFPAYSFITDLSGVDYEIMYFLDTESEETSYAPCVGKIQYSGADYDVYIGQMTPDGKLLSGWSFIAEDGMGYWGGDIPIFFIMYQGSPSMICQIEEIYITTDGGLNAKSVKKYNAPVKLNALQPAQNIQVRDFVK